MVRWDTRALIIFAGGCVSENERGGSTDRGLVHLVSSDHLYPVALFSSSKLYVFFVDHFDYQYRMILCGMINQVKMFGHWFFTTSMFIRSVSC